MESYIKSFKNVFKFLMSYTTGINIFSDFKFFEKNYFLDTRNAIEAEWFLNNYYDWLIKNEEHFNLFFNIYTSSFNIKQKPYRSKFILFERYFTKLKIDFSQLNYFKSENELLNEFLSFILTKAPLSNSPTRTDDDDDEVSLQRPPFQTSDDLINSCRFQLKKCYYLNWNLI